MRAHATIFDLGRLLTLTLAVGLSACKSTSDSAPDAEASAPRPVLAPDVLMVYRSGGGISGTSFRLTVFADGRVERTDSRQPMPQVRVPVARVQKLTADLAATGVFAVKDGTWEPPDPVSDSISVAVVARDHAGAVHFYETTGGTAPDTVQRALRIGRAFAREVETQNPRPPCACQPGDRQCACP